MSDPITIGTCGHCGGAVTVPSVWFGTVPPQPTCNRCGKHPIQSFGPVLPMAQSPDSRR